MSSLLIRNADVLHVTFDQRAFILFEHDILVDGNHIEAVQPTGQADPSHFQTVIDATGQIALPGLINTHAHVPMVIFRGLGEDVSLNKWFNDYVWPVEHNLQPDDVYWGMQLGLAEMIRGGCTSVADHYFHMDEAAKVVEMAGTRALLAWATFGDGGDQMIARSAAFVQQWQGAAHGRIRAWMAPHAPYTCDDDHLKASAAMAHKLGVGIHIHAAEAMSQTEISLQKRRQTPIQVLENTGIFDGPTILAHVIGALPGDMEIMGMHGAGVAHAPKTYLKLAMGTAPVRMFRGHGIPVGLATDGAMSNNTLDLWESLRLMAMTQKQQAGVAEVMTIPEALFVATRESARVFGLPDTLGLLEPGALADIILVDIGGVHHQPVYAVPTSLVYNTMASDVRTTICDGQVLMRDRQLLTLNESEIIAQVRSRMSRLARRDVTQRIQEYKP